jgi:hypothetical protein
MKLRTLIWKCWASSNHGGNYILCWPTWRQAGPGAVPAKNHLVCRQEGRATLTSTIHSTNNDDNTGHKYIARVFKATTMAFNSVPSQEHRRSTDHGNNRSSQNIVTQGGLSSVGTQGHPPSGNTLQSDTQPPSTWVQRTLNRDQEVPKGNMLVPIVTIPQSNTITPNNEEREGTLPPELNNTQQQQKKIKKRKIKRLNKIRTLNMNGGKENGTKLTR